MNCNVCPHMEPIALNFSPPKFSNAITSCSALLGLSPALTTSLGSWRVTGT